MHIDCSEKSPGELYHLLIQSILPRPIAWLLTDNGDGSQNLAPFSFFNGLTSRPPTVLLSIGWKEKEVRKDSWRNLEERRHFVLHIPSVDQAKAVSDCAASLAHGQSELEHAGLQTEVVESWPLPRVVGCRIAMLGELDRVIEVGEAPQGLILGRIRAVWIDDAIAQEVNGRLQIDAVKLDPLARLGGDDYCGLGEIFQVERPD